MTREDENQVIQRYTLGAEEPPSKGVYSFIAVLENCSPLELPPLAEVTDPDAMDSLLTEDAEAWRISFEYCDYDVTVTRDEIHVQNRDAE